MAQKRNPVSLRLQTRLQGNEKRFASCWFTDFFFSQACTTDLVKRLYLGYLLQKGGSWYSEKSESRVPETCLSIQFLYRRCSILSVILDRRKEEYVFSSPLKNIKDRREAISTSFRQEVIRLSGTHSGVGVGNTFLNINNPFLSTGNIAIGKTLDPTQGGNLSKDDLNITTFPTYAEFTKQDQSSTSVEELKLSTSVEDFTNHTPYLVIATSFGVSRLKNVHRLVLSRSCRNTKIDKDNNDDNIGVSKAKNLVCTPASSPNQIVFSKQGWRDWFSAASCRYHTVSDSAYLSAIEYLCEISEREKPRQDQHAMRSTINDKHLIRILERRKIGQERLPDLTQGYCRQSLWLGQEKKGAQAPSRLACHWSSWNLIRGVSSFQSIEFCLHSVIFLYKKRLSFLQIKETLFKMLAASGVVRGARLVCSGRQGGRSKSAMRAKKQSALWGQTALSLFSSQLAFASTGVDTSFGQIGIKLWICYKSSQDTVKVKSQAEVRS